VGSLVSKAGQNVGCFCVESCVCYASVCIRSHQMKFVCAGGLGCVVTKEQQFPGTPVLNP